MRAINRPNGTPYLILRKFIGGVIMLDRAELGADEKEEVTLLEYYVFLLFIV